MLSDVRPEKGRPAPRQWFLERLANPLEHDAEEDSSYVGTSRIRPLWPRFETIKMVCVSNSLDLLQQAKSRSQ